MRPLIAALFAAAVSATILAGDGLVLVPHSHAPGTTPEHAHGLTLYRFPIALIGEPADAPQLSPRDQHAALRAAPLPGGTAAGMSLLVLTAAALAFAFVATSVPRRAPAPLAGAEWFGPSRTGPPRLSIA